MSTRRTLAPALTATAVVLTFVLGLVGFHQWDPTIDILDAAYASLQLFVLEYTPVEAHGGPPMLISVLRFVAPVVAASSLLALFGRTTRDIVDRWRAVVSSGHVVVAGVSSMRQALIDNRVRDRQRVVALIQPSRSEERVAAREAGAIAVVGDPRSRIASRAVARASEVLLAFESDSETLRWAEELAPYADAARPQALVQHTDMSAVGEAAGLDNVDILSAARRAATSALSIEGRPHSSQGPARTVIATEGEDAVELVLAIAGQTGAGEHAQVHVVGPTTRRFEQRCGEAIKTISVTVHSCDLDQIAGRVAELEAQSDERWTIADPIYVWLPAHATALAVTRALCEVTRNRICVLTADGDLLLPPSDTRPASPSASNGPAAVGPFARPRVSFLGVTEMSEHGVFLPSSPRTTVLAAYIYADHCRYASLERTCGPHALGPLEVRRWAQLGRRRQTPYIELARRLPEAFEALGIEVRPRRTAESWRQLSNVLLDADELWQMAQDVGGYLGKPHGRRALPAADELRTRQPFVDFVARLPMLLELAGIQLERRSSPQVLTPELIDPIAKRFHEAYLDASGGATWEDLGEARQESNREVARDLPSKIAGLGGSITKQTDPPTTWNLDAELRATLAELEHQRWCRAHFDRGFQYGPVRDFERRTHPNLVPYADLPDADRAKDCVVIDTVPAALAAAGLGVAVPGMNR